MGGYGIICSWFGIVSALVCIPIASIRESKRKEHYAGLGYWWGYFFGSWCASAILLAVFSLYLVVVADHPESRLYVLTTVWLTVLAISGVFIIKRQRWAWFVGTILSIQLILWLVNAFYVWNRWAEFKSEAGG